MDDKYLLIISFLQSGGGNCADSQYKLEVEVDLRAQVHVRNAAFRWCLIGLKWFLKRMNKLWLHNRFYHVLRE